MRYAPHASRYSLFALAVSAALLPGAGWAANGDLAGARKPPSVACSWNREAALSYEERRLDTPLPFSGANVVTHDQTPLAERIRTNVARFVAGEPLVGVVDPRSGY